MDITARALKHIRRIKSRRGLPPATGVRLALRDGGVCLEWEPKGPRVTDLIVRREKPPVFVEARVYVRLADYRLDVRDDAPVFQLTPKDDAARKYRRNNP